MWFDETVKKQLKHHQSGLSAGVYQLGGNLKIEAFLDLCRK